MNMKTNQGFSIIEVLIAFVILVVGLLGATTLIIRSSQVNANAYETEQVAMLANTMVEKIRANPDGIDIYINMERPTAPVASCVAKDDSCAYSDRATTDKYRFQEQIDRLTVKDVSWQLESSGASTLTGVSGKLYTLTITWGPVTTGASKNAYYLNFVL